MQVGIGAVKLAKHTKEGSVETHELHFNGALLVEHIYDEEANSYTKNYGAGHDVDSVTSIVKAEIASLKQALGGIHPRSTIGQHIGAGNHITAFVLFLDNINLIATSYISKVTTNKTMKAVPNENFIFMVIQNNQPHTTVGTNSSMIRVVDLKTADMQQAIKNGELVSAKFKELNMTGYAILPKTFSTFHLAPKDYASIFEV